MIKRFFLHFLAVISVFLSFTLSSRVTYAQRPPGDFGFGLILGDPLGATVKYWLNSTNALVGDIGESYFGSPRIDVDYLWHFNSFNSRVVLLYAGFGGAIGFGTRYGYYGVFYRGDGEGHPFFYRDDNKSVGIGIRAIFGLNIVPKRTPLEFFLELGPLIGVVPAFGVGVDAAVGIRFYP